MKKPTRFYVYTFLGQDAQGTVWLRDNCVETEVGVIYSKFLELQEREHVAPQP